MKYQLKLLLVINLFFVFAINLFAPLYAIFVQDIESAVYHVGGIWSFYILCVGILTLIISKYENHKEYADYFLILGFICRACGWTAYLFASSIYHLYFIQLIMALGEAFGNPAFNLLYSSYLTKDHFASDWGINTAINSFVIALASFLGGIIVYYFGFTILFYIMITLSLVSTGLAFEFRRSFS